MAKINDKMNERIVQAWRTIYYMQGIIYYKERRNNIILYYQVSPYNKKTLWRDAAINYAFTKKKVIPSSVNVNVVSMMQNAASILLLEKITA